MLAYGSTESIEEETPPSGVETPPNETIEKKTSPITGAIPPTPVASTASKVHASVPAAQTPTPTPGSSSRSSSASGKASTTGYMSSSMEPSYSSPARPDGLRAPSPRRSLKPILLNAEVQTIDTAENDELQQNYVRACYAAFSHLTKTNQQMRDFSQTRLRSLKTLK
jgi:hypothetical protein